MDLQLTIRRGAERLAAAGIASCHTDAELLAAHAWGLSRAQLQLQALSGTGAHPADPQQTRFWELIEERARRVPLQHITGFAPFRWLELRVGPGVFVPRPETETVVELALQHLRTLHSEGVRAPRVVDLGTGSGAIAASIALEFPNAEVHAVELSAEAAAWAQLNFQRLPATASKVTLHQCDLRDFPRQWSQDPAGGESSFDVVVSNPPYIPPHMVPVEQEVRDHDPEIALYGGGPEGLELPAAVVSAAVTVLAPGGRLILEHAEVQAEAVAGLCRAEPALTSVQSHQDLTGRQRATSARVRSTSEPAA